jgi:hypothetical protein
MPEEMENVDKRDTVNNRAEVFEAQGCGFESCAATERKRRPAELDVNQAKRQRAVVTLAMEIDFS